MRMKLLQVESRDEWRQWLSDSHAAETEIWLVFYKAHTGKARFSYEDMVREALCFGWIDSLVKRIDEESYAQKFTPRRSGSAWSEINKTRAEAMIADGLMRSAGQKLVDDAKSSGEWERVRERPIVPTDTIPQELEEALSAHEDAARFFGELAPTYQKQYILWIATAKRAATRQRRAAEAVKKLGRGEKLGLK